MNVLGFVGLGIMGEAMAGNIIRKSGKPVHVFDVDPEKTARVVAVGGIAGMSAADVASKADLVFTMVPKSEHVKQVVGEMLPSVRQGTIIIDMSTISPVVSAELAESVREKGGDMLDAPVVKSRPAALKGELGIYVGGDKKIFKQVRPILECMGKNIIHMGKNGTGLVMKICHNMLVSQIQNGVNEMLALTEKAGIRFDDMITAISYGGGQNFYLDAKRDALKTGDFTPVFSFENMLKDVGLASELAEFYNLKLRGLDVVRDVYDAGMAKGMAKEDFAASVRVVRDMASQD